MSVLKCILVQKVGFVKYKVTCFVYGLSPYRAVNTLQLGYKNQSLNIGWGTAVAQWLRRRATNRKVASSIPAGVIGNFH